MRAIMQPRMPSFFAASIISADGELGTVAIFSFSDLSFVSSARWAGLRLVSDPETGLVGCLELNASFIFSGAVVLPGIVVATVSF